MAIISPAAQNAAVAAVAALIDAGSAGSAVLELRTGAPSADIEDPPSGTLLATANLSNPAFSSPIDGVVESEDLPIAMAGLDDGEIGHYRVADRDGNTVIHSASVGVGVGELQVDSLSVETSEDITVTAWTLAMLNGTTI